MEGYTSHGGSRSLQTPRGAAPVASSNSSPSDCAGNTIATRDRNQEPQCHDCRSQRQQQHQHQQLQQKQQRDHQSQLQLRNQLQEHHFPLQQQQHNKKQQQQKQHQHHQQQMQQRQDKQQQQQHHQHQKQQPCEYQRGTSKQSCVSDPKPPSNQSFAQSEQLHASQHQKPKTCSRCPSEQQFTLHLRTRPSPPVKRKTQHETTQVLSLKHPHTKLKQQQQQTIVYQNSTSQPQQQQQISPNHPHHQSKRLHLQIVQKPRIPVNECTCSATKIKPEAQSRRNNTMTSSKEGVRDKRGTTTGCNSPSGNPNQENKFYSGNYSTEPSGSQQTNKKVKDYLPPKTSKTNKNSVCASETGKPKSFIADLPRVEFGSGGKSAKKIPNHDLRGIPQTNLSVGLIVFCCFNPVFGAMAIYLSLTAAKAYRDGHEARGSSRAHWSILVSLLGITVTMVVVSTLVVAFSMTKPGTSQYRTSSKTLGY